MTELDRIDVADEDLQQEYMLETWLSPGKKISKRILRFNLENQMGRVLYFGDITVELESFAKPMWSSNKTDPETIKQIIDWAKKQPQSIYDAVIWFLDSPSEDRLHKVIRVAGLELDRSIKKEKVSMSSIIRKALPATKEELILLVQRISPDTKRPAATVRQFIRSETRRGKLIEVDNLYHQI